MILWSLHTALLLPPPLNNPLCLFPQRHFRGDCFFVEKAWHAQQAGAKAIIVADHTQEGLVTMAVPEDNPDVAALVSKISIPTALVTKVGAYRWRRAREHLQGITQPSLIRFSVCMRLSLCL